MHVFGFESQYFQTLYSERPRRQGMSGTFESDQLSLQSSHRSIQQCLKDHLAAETGAAYDLDLRVWESKPDFTSRGEWQVMENNRQAGILVLNCRRLDRSN
jgi:hypothetical protein